MRTARTMLILIVLAALAVPATASAHVTLQPKEIARGDIKIELPPSRTDVPAEFVLTLAFGGQTTSVRYRERDPRVQVGDVEPTTD